ncbi:MAG: hypothetical protein UHY68_00705 [Acutalibacteraceae bacterium]|nr:hypothetical protein [Acutalibacteraceae bacterium]
MKENSADSIKKGIVLVFAANFINLMISLVNGFILPKYLSVDTYAGIKTYQLYASYIGVLALGYSDGLYLKYGGKKISSIPNKEINIARSNLIVLQIIMMLIFAGIGFIAKDYILMIISLTFIPVNIVSNFKNILQATGEFKTYSGIMNYTSILTFIGTMTLLFVFKIDNPYYYVSIMATVSFIVWILLERKIKKFYDFKLGFVVSFKNLIENIKSGIILMLGNFSSILMTGIDRWFVKFLLTTTDFAYYSFVVSTENLIVVFINPIVTTMYNYICTQSDYTAIRKIKRMCLIFALFLVSSAFAIKFILEVYLNKYLASQYVLFLLFSTEILFMIIKGIYVNIYKARKQQSIYLKQLIVAIVLGCILNAIFYFVFHSIEGIALATLISVIFWYIMCSATVKEIKPDWKELLVLLISISVFIFSGFCLPSILGFFVYVAVILVLCMLFMKKDFFAMIKMATDMVKKKLHKA